MFAENYKALKKESLNKADVPHSWIDNPNVVKMAILCELIYKKSMQSQYKPPTPFSYTYQQSDFKICKENEMDRNRQTTFKRRREVRYPTLCDHKTYHKY